MTGIKDKAFSVCMQLAQSALQKNEIPIAAVIVHNNEILSSAHNQTVFSYNPCAHAELLAISAATEKIKSTHLINCDLYTTLEPCLMCYQAAKIARIRYIYFIHSDANFGVFTKFHHLDLMTSHSHKITGSGPYPEYDPDNIVKKFFQTKRRD